MTAKKSDTESKLLDLGSPGPGLQASLRMIGDTPEAVIIEARLDGPVVKQSAVMDQIATTQGWKDVLGTNLKLMLMVGRKDPKRAAAAAAERKANG